MKKLNKLNSRNVAKPINAFGFSTIHTKLPHDKLRTVLHKLLDLCFDGIK